MTADLEHELDQLASALAEVQRRAREGEAVDMSLLDAQVQAVADAAEGLDAARMAELRPRIARVLTAYEQLDQTLRAELESVKEELSNHGQRAHAMRTYGQLQVAAETAPRR
ncbi:hypothetical protein SAMN05216241_103206 [Limimonas halophila]|uniref:Flagellar protein FliT n=1 Tax=Limimonas halophila TaxID=1082479 RepID=A0A1G7Q5U3_9PROT|nr:hypothetical protein [Limimonas halophila]SDF92970.1 hypothetical protein SAMN05216241_103206 [Limimonas halophila]